jgi:hypothetical protein
MKKWQVSMVAEYNISLYTEHLTHYTYTHTQTQPLHAAMDSKVSHCHPRSLPSDIMVRSTHSRSLTHKRLCLYVLCIISHILTCHFHPSPQHEQPFEHAPIYNRSPCLIPFGPLDLVPLPIACNCNGFNFRTI